MDSILSIYQDVVASFDDSKLCIVPDLNQGERLKEFILITSLISCGAGRELGKVNKYSKVLENLSDERILFTKENSIPEFSLECNLRAFDLKDSIRAFPSNVTLAQALGISTKLYSLLGLKGEYFCELDNCENKKISLEKHLDKLINSNDREDLIFCIVEDYVVKEANYLLKDYFSWKLREEINNGVSKFFLNEKYHSLSGESDFSEIIESLECLSILRRSFSNSDNIKDSILNVLLSELFSSDSDSQLWLYKCEKVDSNLKVIDKVCLDISYECKKCKKSFLKDGSYFLANKDSKKPISLNKRYGLLSYENLEPSSFLSFCELKNKLSINTELNNHKELVEVLDQLISSGLSDMPLSLKLSDLSDTKAILFLLFILSHQDLESYLIIFSLNVFDNKEIDYLIPLLNNLHLKGLKILLYGGEESAIIKISKYINSNIIDSEKKALNCPVDCRDYKETLVSAYDKRQNIANLFGLSNVILSLLSSTMEARVLGLNSEDFFSNESFKCSSCKGLGYFSIDLPLLYKWCKVCKGCNGGGLSNEVNRFKYMSFTYNDFLSIELESLNLKLGSLEKIGPALESLVNSGLGSLNLGRYIFELTVGEKINLNKALLNNN
jgi:hypothetical protein